MNPMRSADPSRTNRGSGAMWRSRARRWASVMAPGDGFGAGVLGGRLPGAGGRQQRSLTAAHRLG